MPWTQYDLEFPDGPRDAETLLVDPATGRLYVVSKRVQGAAVYAAPKQLSASHVNVLTKVAKAPPLVTDGAFARDGRLVIRDYLRRVRLRRDRRGLRPPGAASAAAGGVHHLDR